LLGFEQQGIAKVRVQIMRDESMRLAAQASALGGDQFSPPPEAAPAGNVQVQALDAGTASAAGAAPAAPAAPAAKPTALGQVQTPVLDGSVSLQPVKGDRLFIQAGAFLRVANAQKLTQKLSRFGQARVTQFVYNKQTFYRVQLGPIASVEEADRLLQQLLEAGHKDARITVN
jgi:rare lipoprotein A